jgi:hypothetical protein
MPPSAHYAESQYGWNAFAIPSIVAHPLLLEMLT